MSSARSLEGHVTLVTGASTGIGRASALALARAGADVALAARRTKLLEEVAVDIENETGVDTFVSPTDVSKEEEVDEMVETSVDALGGLDVVVNNAGIARDHVLEDVQTREYREVMGVNVDGAFFTTRAALPYLRASKGILVFVGSYAGHFPYPANPLYASTKWWLRGFASSIAAAAGTDDVGVTLVNPSEVRTAFNFGPDDPTPYRDRFDSDEATDPAVIADAVVFASSQEPPNAVFEIDLYRRDKFSSF